jgi:digeranylgeranylglycerophospholipid reductase
LKDYYDVVVVGAGPAGSIAAKFAAENGVSVLLVEKDRDVGYPVRCGEAVSRAGVEEFIASDEKWINAKIKKFSLNAPDGTEAVVEFEEEGYVLERRIFDYQLAVAASNAGAEVLTRAYVNGLLFDGSSAAGIKFEHQGIQKQVKAKVVIAADGVESRVGRWAGIKTDVHFKEMESCVQITASNINVNTDTLYFFFGKQVAPQGYFWIFPKGEGKANIGLGISGLECKKKSALSYLNDFMDSRYPSYSTLTTIAGGVPSTPTLKKISAPGILLAGDAARQVNPLSGGGIASGMIGGSIAGKVAAESVKFNKPGHLLNYEALWHKRLGHRHEIFNRIKNGVFNFEDKRFNEIAKAFNKVPQNKRSLGNLFKTALISNPSLILEAAKVFLIK